MKSKKTKAESAVLVLQIAGAFAACIASANQALAQGAGESKIPRPLPHMQDIKTPPNSPSVKAGSSVVPRASGEARAGATPQSKPAAPSAHVPRFEIDHVYFDTPGDGAVWALGAEYKASFRTSGATYIPFLGSCAPRNYPVEFALRSVSVGDVPIGFDPNAAPVHAGTRVVYDRGGIVETYELKLGSAEQEFEIASLPSGGDLVLEIAVGTTLDAAETTDGLRWSNALGSVAYSRAVLVDAAQHRTPVLTHVSDGMIEIRVPADVLAGAVFPIVIDPVISTFTVDASTNDDTDPDIAYDSTNNVYQVVWSRLFSAGDHDCYSQLQSANGTTIVGSTVQIDFTTDDWVRPRTANNLIATQFLVAAQVTPTGGSLRVIKGRTRDAASTSMGAQFQISDPTINYDQFNVSVGGDPNPLAPTYYCVAWERVFIAGSDDDIFARLVLSNSTLLGTSTILIDNSSSTLDTNPSVSRSDGNAPATGQDWTIVWQREFNPSDHDIRGAQVHWDGTITNASFSIDFSANDDTRPQVSSVLDGSGTSRNYLVVYERFIGPDHDIEGALLNSATVLRFDDLSAVENSGFQSQDQVQPSVDSDGAFYGVSYSEQFMTSTTDYDIFITTFDDTASAVTALETHVTLAATSEPEHFPQMTSRHSGGADSPRYGIVWSAEFSPTDHDVLGAIYLEGLQSSYCSAGFDGVIGCPCANQGVVGAGCNNSHNTGGAVLSSSGIGSLANDSLLFLQSGELPTSLSIFLQGNANIPAGVFFGDGVRCAGGTLKRLFTHNAVSGTVTAPSGSDSAVHVRSAALGDTISAGTYRFYQVYYRDPNLTFCPSGFNVGNARQVAWSP
jgi:hypothetical protein